MHPLDLLISPNASSESLLQTVIRGDQRQCRWCSGLKYGDIPKGGKTPPDHPSVVV